MLSEICIYASFSRKFSESRLAWVFKLPNKHNKFLFSVRVLGVRDFYPIFQRMNFLRQGKAELTCRNVRTPILIYIHVNSGNTIRLGYFGFARN